jgi:hypothetical protein
MKLVFHTQLKIKYEERLYTYMTTELQQTRGSVRLHGQIVGLQNEGTFREGVTKNGEGVPFRSASLAIKTSPNNVVYNLDLFGQVIEGKKVKVFSNKNNEKKTLEIDFEDRDNLPEGFTPLGFGTVRTGLQKDEKGKVIQKNYFNYDGVEVIKESLEDGDSVYINAEFNPNTYTSNGEQKTTVKYTVTGIGFLKNPIDFESEEFKEIASFEQEFVVISTNINKEAKKLYIVGRLIRFDKTWDDVTFVIDANKYETLAKNFMKKTKFGDVVKVQGVIRNGTILEEKKDEEQELDWGGEIPEGQKKLSKDRISELQITNVVEHKPKVYKEDDFIKEEDPFGSDNGGFSDNPFEEDAGDPWG